MIVPAVFPRLRRGDHHPSYRWKVEGGRWKVEGGRWKVEGGRWKVEGGRWKVAICGSLSSHRGLVLRLSRDLVSVIRLGFGTVQRFQEILARSASE
jgi:hypothetical protein